jgi:hypothetical protein
MDDGGLCFSEVSAQTATVLARSKTIDGGPCKQRIVEPSIAFLQTVRRERYPPVQTDKNETDDLESWQVFVMDLSVIISS